MAELAGASKSYGKTLALDDVSLQVKRGELLAVLGPNGAGKSTAIAIWLGLIEPDKGTASLMGGLPSNVDCRRRVGVMMQEVEIRKQLRVVVLIALTASYYRDPMSVEKTLEAHTRRISRVAHTASCPAVRSARCSSLSRSAASPSCCFSTNPRRDSTCDHAGPCGRRFRIGSTLGRQ